jgi:hypothetical protein
MSSERGKGKGFSPTFHLLSALSTTLMGSLPQIAKCTDSDTTDLCDKKRHKNIHLCVDAKDNSVILALCNAKEGCARATLIHSYQGIGCQKTAEKVLGVLKKSGLNAKIEVGVSGGCERILQKAENIQPIRTPTPINRVNSATTSFNTSQKKEELMTIKRENLSPRELQVFDAAVQIANGEEGKLVLIEGITPALKAALPDDFPEKTIGGLIRSLKKKKFFVDGGRSNAKVRCLYPPKDEVSTGIENGPSKAIVEETIGAKEDEPTAIEVNAQIARLAPDPSTSNQLMAILGRIEDPEKLAENLLAGDLKESELWNLHTLFEVVKALQAKEHCPHFKGLAMTKNRAKS